MAGWPSEWRVETRAGVRDDRHATVVLGDLLKSSGVSGRHSAVGGHRPSGIENTNSAGADDFRRKIALAGESLAECRRRRAIE